MLRPNYTVGFRRSKAALFEWNFVRLDLLVLLIVGRVDCIDFVLFLEAVGVGGVLLYGSRKSVGRSVLRAVSASHACFARDEPSSNRVGDVELSRKPPKLRSWRCTQPRAAEATAGLAVVGQMAATLRAALVV